MPFENSLAALAAGVPATLYTVPNTVSAVVHGLVCRNSGTTSDTVLIDVVSGDTSYPVWSATIAAGEAAVLPSKLNLAATDALVATSTAGTTAVHASLYADNANIGLTFNARGGWSPTAPYQPMDFVHHDGVAYYAVQANANSEPSAANPQWQQVTSGIPATILDVTQTVELQAGYTTQVYTLSSVPTVVPSFANGALQALVVTTATSIDVPTLGSGVMEIEVDNTGEHGVATTGNFAAVTGVPPTAGIGRLTVTRFATRTYGDWQ